MTETAQLVHGHMRYLHNDDMDVQHDDVQHDDVQPIQPPPPTIMTRSASKLRDITRVVNDIELFSDMLEHGNFEPVDQAQIMHCLKVRLEKGNNLLPFKYRT